MDLTPQTLRDVEFREKLRGYHPDDVDDFLEEVAVALDGVLTRLRTAEAAAGGATPTPATLSAPVAAAAVSDPNLSEGTLSRALLLAQRTADLAVAEAEQSARQLLDEARAEADRILAETQAKVGAMTEEARSSAESAVAELDQRRVALEREVAALQSWAAQHRDRLREVLSDQLRSLDIWLATSAVPRPATRTVSPVAPSVPEAAEAPPVAAAPSADEAPVAAAPSSDEPTSAYAPVGGPAEMLPSADNAQSPGAGADGAAADGVAAVAAVTDPDATDTGEGPDGVTDGMHRRRSAPDSPGAAVSEAVAAGTTLTSTGASDLRGGGGGDGVVLFDQESVPIEGIADDGGARMAGRFFRQR